MKAVGRRCSGDGTWALTAAGIAAALAMTTTLDGLRQRQRLGGDVTLTLVAADYGDRRGQQLQEVLGRARRAFEAEHPGIKVDVHVYSTGTTSTRKVADMVEAGQGARHRADRLLRRLRRPRASSTAPTSCSPSARRPTSSRSLADAGECNQTPVRHAVRLQHPAALLQQEAVRRGGHRTPPKTWDDIARRRRACSRQRGVKMPVRAAARPRGGPGRDHDVDAQRRRRLHRQRRHATPSTRPRTSRPSTG